MSDGSLLETIGSFLHVVAFLLAGILYPVLQLAALILWNGLWRVGALLPLLFMIPVGIEMVDLFRQGANLAPIPFLMTAPYATAWLGILAAGRYARRLRPTI